MIAAGEDALVIRNLSKSFGKLQVLRAIDLTVAQHEVICLIGASGSGKSTLLRCINLIEPVDSGHFVIDERPDLVRARLIALADETSP